MGIPLNLVVFIQRTIWIFRIILFRAGFDRLGIGDDDVGSDNAFFQQQFVAFIEQFLNFGVLVTIQEPVKIGGVRQFSEWESDHVTDQRSTSKVSKQFRNACDLLGIFVDQRLKETDRSIAQSAGAFV